MFEVVNVAYVVIHVVWVHSALRYENLCSLTSILFCLHSSCPEG